MNFCGSIIITDPCYIAKGNEWHDKDVFYYDDWALRKINSPFITQYLWKETGMGDGSWRISGLDKITNHVEVENFIDNINNAKDNYLEKQTILNELTFENYLKQQHYLGQFSVDSGSFGVFYLNEVLKHKPDFFRCYGVWCYTIIEDFIGDVNIYYPNHEDKTKNRFHIIGLGNKTFFSL